MHHVTIENIAAAVPAEVCPNPMPWISADGFVNGSSVLVNGEPMILSVDQTLQQLLKDVENNNGIGFDEATRATRSQTKSLSVAAAADKSGEGSNRRSEPSGSGADGGGPPSGPPGGGAGGSGGSGGPGGNDGGKDKDDPKDVS